MTLAAQEAATQPESSQVEAQKQLEEERLDVSMDMLKILLQLLIIHYYVEYLFLG